MSPLDLKGLLTKDEYRAAVAAVNTAIAGARATRTHHRPYHTTNQARVMKSRPCSSSDGTLANLPFVCVQGWTMPCLLLEP